MIREERKGHRFVSFIRISKRSELRLKPGKRNSAATTGKGRKKVRKGGRGREGDRRRGS